MNTNDNNNELNEPTSLDLINSSNSEGESEDKSALLDKEKFNKDNSDSVEKTKKNIKCLN